MFHVRKLPVPNTIKKRHKTLSLKVQYIELIRLIVSGQNMTLLNVEKQNIEWQLIEFDVDVSDNLYISYPFTSTSNVV